uniref:site-specific DNA-methyltransferase (cytosine-N(4)-specific) n=2 Tax=cellular organisms TaxID=131567 RepID=A0A7C3YGG1_9EURY
MKDKQPKLPLESEEQTEKSEIRHVLFRELTNEIPSTTYATHSLYMHPAKFIPHVVRYVIDKYTEPCDWLFDPFAGYGTVAIEASMTNRNCILWDLNPILILMIRASLFRDSISLDDFYIDTSYSEKFHPKWENIFYWHPAEFYDVLSSMWGYWHREVDEKIKPLLAIPLLKVTRYFSYSDEKITKLYKSKYAKEKVEALLKTNWKSKMEKMYWKYVEDVIKKVKDYQRYEPHQVECIVKASDEGIFTENKVIVDSTKKKLEKCVDVLITSPPYLQAQEYIRSFKLELAWLGFSGHFIRSLVKHEIPYNSVEEGQISSPTYDRFKKEISRLKHEKLLQLYVTYFNSLALFLNNNHHKVGNVIAFFVSNVKIRTKRIPIDTILREHLEYLGWKHEETLIDTILARRLFKTDVNPATKLSDQRTPTEHLVVMRCKR